jgi:hypothetical protein
MLKEIRQFDMERPEHQDNHQKEIAAKHENYRAPVQSFQLKIIPGYPVEIKKQQHNEKYVSGNKYIEWRRRDIRKKPWIMIWIPVVNK